MLEPILLLGAPGEDVHSRGLLSAEVVQQCFAGRLYFTLSERYLWGRWHREHSPLTSFHFTLTSAQRQAELLRAPGAAWVIKELPALVLRGDERAVVLTELDEPMPFKRQPPPRARSRALLDLADAVSDGSDPRTLIRLVVSSRALQPANGSFRTYRSVRRRPGEPLDWALTRTPARRANAVEQLVRGISAALDLPQSDPPAAGT